MYYRIGTCGLCGGDVIGWRGAWYGDNAPEGDKCKACDTFVACDVIQMSHYNMPEAPIDVGLTMKIEQRRDADDLPETLQE